MDGEPSIPQEDSRYFVTTRWSVILATQQDESQKLREAFSELCRAYWKPICFYLKYNGFKRPDAEDAAQDFFVKILDANFFALAQQEKGRFRAFLLTALQNFLRDRKGHAEAQKRGGGRVEVPSDLDEELWTLPAKNATPEQMFDTSWAMIVSQRALSLLRDECRRKGREHVFQELEPFLTTDSEVWDYEKAERGLGLPQRAVRVLVCRLRERYRHLLRQEIVATVSDETEVDAELRHLYSLLCRQGEAS